MGSSSLIDMSEKPKIIFLKVTDNASKMTCLCETAQTHFQQGHKVLFSVPSAEAARFLDQLLWKSPQESFLPHSVANSPSKDFIAITSSQENVNNATVLFNLHPNVNPIYTQFKTVYELFDETLQDKLLLSQQRQAAYREAGFDIS